MAHLVERDAVRGSLTLLGTSQSQTGGRRYSTIEIGDKIIKGVTVTSELESFLNRALNQEGETTLYIVKNIIYGVKLPDGRVYYNILPTGNAWFMLIFSIAGIVVFFGLLLLPFTIKTVVLTLAVNGQAEQFSRLDGAIAT